MSTARELAASVDIKSACEAMSVARPSYYRRYRRVSKPRRDAVERPPNLRRYSDDERETMLQVLNSERFCDKSPEQVEVILAEDNKHMGSA